MSKRKPRTRSVRVPHPYTYTVEKVVTKKELEARNKELQTLLREEKEVSAYNARFRDDYKRLLIQLSTWTIIAMIMCIIMLLAKVWVLA